METTKAVSFDTDMDFQVPVEKLYEAWTKEEALKTWWKPNGNTLKSLVNDLKEGGEVKYEFGDNEGKTIFTIGGTYEAVKPNEQLIYTWNWDIPEEPIRNAEYKLTVLFKSQGEGSRLEVKQEGFKDDESIVPHREGWEIGLNSLKNYLSGNS